MIDPADRIKIEQVKGILLQIKKDINTTPIMDEFKKNTL